MQSGRHSAGPVVRIPPGANPPSPPWRFAFRSIGRMPGGKSDRKDMNMTDDAPISAVETPDRETSSRPWVVPRVQRLIASSAEIGIAGSTDATENLS
jgi:hypothetical protein